jgi:hypothetical protein
MKTVMVNKKTLWKTNMKLKKYGDDAVGIQHAKRTRKEEDRNDYKMVYI